MTIFVNYYQAAPGAVNVMHGVEAYLESARTEALNLPLLELVKLRVSQINGCAYCLDMHSKDARAGGETEQRLHLLAAWREAPFYSAAERAALAWAEALTNLAQRHPDPALVQELKTHFSDREIADLTLAITQINSWNRFAVGLGAKVGSYQPSSRSK